jgi:hypothetical protein
MATLYIANCMKQTYEFIYRVPGDDMQTLRKLNTVTISPGTQARVHVEAPLSVLDAIVDQHRHYGLVPVSEMVTTRGFVGICYSFDRPVPLDQLQYAVDHNDGVLFDRGTKQQEDAAIVVDQALESTIGARTGQPLRAVEIEVAEDSDSPKLNSAIRVSRDPAVAQMRQGQRRA